MWTEDQISEYNQNGFRVVRNLLNSQELAGLNGELSGLLKGEDGKDRLHRERERSGAVRQIYLTHRHSEPFRGLSRDQKIVKPVRQILNNDSYIWHSKVNVKDAFEGTVWLWHQDYGYWIRDGVDPKMVSVMIFLDQATLNNGCLMVAAGSHRWGVLPHISDEVTTSYKQWCVEIPTLRERLTEEMIQPVTGQAGDAIFFHPNLLHGSGHNMSPLPRKTIILVYNDIDNKPRPVEQPRPDWVVAREFEVVR